MFIYSLFNDCRESLLRTCCRQIHQCAKIGKYIIKVSYDSVECLEQQEYQSVRNRYF